MKQKLLNIIAAGALVVFSCAAHAAEKFPTKPVRFVVPFTVGSATDALARILGQKMAENWGQQLVVDNRAGAGSVVGTSIAAKSAPDGYTLLMVSASHAVNATLFSKLPYDTLRDFSGVALVASIPNILIVNNIVPAKNLKELIALAKAQPGKFNYGSAGIGAASHLNGELFKSMAGIDIAHVPFKGFGEQLPELFANRLQFTFAPVILAQAHIQAGRVRALAVSTAKRSTVFPDVPSMEEAGMPGCVFDPWFGVLVPAATPKGIVARLNQEIGRVLQLPDVRKQLLNQGAEPALSTPQEFDAYLRSEVVKLGKIVKASGARVD